MTHTTFTYCTILTSFTEPMNQPADGRPTRQTKEQHREDWDRIACCYCHGVPGFRRRRRRTRPRSPPATPTCARRHRVSSTYRRANRHFGRRHAAGESVVGGSEETGLVHLGN